MLRRVRDVLEPIEEFTQDAVQAALEGLVAELGVKPKQVFQPIRVALAGRAISPGIFETRGGSGSRRDPRTGRSGPSR